MLSPLDIALGLQNASEEIVAEPTIELVLQHAVDGVVLIEGMPLARLWTVEKSELNLATVAARDVIGPTSGARPWAERVVLDRKAFTSNRLFHGMGTPDVDWMRSNRFRAYVGLPFALKNGDKGVFDLFGMRPLHEDALRSISSYLRLVIARLNDLSLMAGEIAADVVEIPTDVRYEEAERRFVRAVLARLGGQIEGPDGAASVLGLAPSTLRSRLKRLKMR